MADEFDIYNDSNFDGGIGDTVCQERLFYPLDLVSKGFTKPSFESQLFFFFLIFIKKLKANRFVCRDFR